MSNPRETMSIKLSGLVDNLTKRQKDFETRIESKIDQRYDLITSAIDRVNEKAKSLEGIVHSELWHKDRMDLWKEIREIRARLSLIEDSIVIVEPVESINTLFSS